MNSSISSAAMQVLSRATVQADRVILNDPSLDRKLYMEVNEVLARLGGKWKGGKIKAHLFSCDPGPLLAQALESNRMPDKNPLAYFRTPDSLADEMVSRISEANAKLFLEPSAGDGAIADAIRRRYRHVDIDCIEIDENRAISLYSNDYKVMECDFLKLNSSKRYTAVLMNPPFSSKEDKLVYILHIQKAFDLLAPGGELIGIAPIGFTFREDRCCKAFKAFVEKYGDWEELPEGTFKDSGTNVATAILWLEKPEDYQA